MTVPFIVFYFKPKRKSRSFDVLDHYKSNANRNIKRNRNLIK